MIIDIPDEWIKRLLNAGPAMTANEAIKVHFRNRDIINDKHIVYAFGEYTIHYLGMQINEKS